MRDWGTEGFQLLASTHTCMDEYTYTGKCPQPHTCIHRNTSQTQFKIKLKWKIIENYTHKYKFILNRQLIFNLYLRPHNVLEKAPL